MGIGAGPVFTCWLDQKPVRVLRVTDHRYAAQVIVRAGLGAAVPLPDVPWRNFMPLVADVVDAGVGDTHRDTHALEMSAPNGASIATIAIDNDDAGFEQALAWIVELAPGLGSRSAWKEPAATASA